MPRRIRPPSARRLFRFVRRSPNDVRDDVQEEFAFHLEMRVDDLVAQGLTAVEARAQALREFGNQTAGADACVREGTTVERQRTLTRLADELWQDASFGARLLRHSPGFATVAILTLAVAIGGNTAMFSVVNALALKPLPVRAPEEVVRIYTGESRTSWLNYQDIVGQSTVFTDIAAHTGTTRALTLDDTTTSMAGETTTSNYFTMLGVPAVLGRPYFPSDARVDVIVLAERTWRTRFGSDPSIVGRTILVAGRSFEVIGVMPRGFRGARAPGFVSEFWVPIDPSQSRRTLEDRDRNTFEIVARLGPGVSAEQAQAATLVVGKRLAAEYPEAAARLALSEVFRIDGIGGFRGMTKTLAPLFAFVGLMTIVAGLVLLVGCANIAGLLLGRGAARRREIGVRLALGAGRGRLIRQLLTESLLLALLGGIVGGVLALWLGGSINLLVSRLPVPIEFDLTLDRRMFVYTLALSLLTAVLCGLAPARSATRMTVVPALKLAWRARHQARASAHASLARGRTGGLVVRAPPLGRPLRSQPLERSPGRPRIRSGWRSCWRICISTTKRHDSGAIVPQLAELQTRISGLHGVQAQGLGEDRSACVQGPRRNADAHGNRPTGPAWPNGARQSRQPRVVSDVADSAAGRTGFRRGADSVGAPRVVLVNETLARQFWNGNALGQTARRG